MTKKEALGICWTFALMADSVIPELDTALTIVAKIIEEMSE